MRTDNLLRKNLWNPVSECMSIEMDEEIIPNFFRLAYAYRYLVESNERKVESVKSASLLSNNEKISNQQVIILFRLYIVEKTPINQLAISMNIKLPNILAQLTKLQNYKLIQKVPSKEDKRVTYVNITKRGKALVDQRIESEEEKYVKVLSSMPNKQKKEVKNALLVLMKHLKNQMPDLFDSVYKYH